MIFLIYKEDSIITYTPMEYIKNGYYIPNTAQYDTISHSLTTYQEGDIVMAKVTPCFENGNIAIMNDLSSKVGMGSSELFVFRASRINVRYLFYWLRNDIFIQSACSTMTGTGGLKRVSPTFVKNCYIHLPNEEEQQAIADFLDRRCAEIDAVIEQTKITIEEYKKLKQSVITEAVTKGIRGNRPMKDSGVEWIGEIPSEWSVIRTKFISDSMSKGNGITKEQIVQNGDSPCVRYGEIYSKYNHSFSNCITKTNKSMYTNLQYFSYGDILFACTGELPEEIGKNIVYLGNEDCLAGGDIIVMKHSQNPSFLNYVHNSYGQTQKSLGKTKLKVVHISPTEIANIFVALPSLPEQHQIADFLDKKCSEIDKLVTKKEQIVVELEAYKKSLIYEVVTGKRSV